MDIPGISITENESASFMSRNTIRILVIFSTLSILGVVITQIYWVKKALDIKERQFTQQAHIALQEVASQLASLNNVMLLSNPVEQLSPEYFLVNTNSTTQPDILEHFLKESFIKHDLITDFEVGIYDCTTDKVRYGMSLSTRNSDKTPAPTAGWTTTDKFPYYFGIRFPHQAGFYAGEFQGWLWSSGLILIALSFFAYALVVILRQKQLSEVQRDFINNMTHELQTPISTILIASDVLSHPDIREQPERLSRYVSIIGDEIRRLQKQVENTLKIALTEKRKPDLRLEEIDVNQVLRTLIAKYKSPIHTDFTENLPRVPADRNHFESLFSNLIDNAIKYSDAPPQVTVRTLLHHHHLLIRVEDKGAGIPKNQHRKIFGNFYRIPTGNIHNVKGFGIGLSYVKQIVKVHGWKISLESKPGHGSAFTVMVRPKTR